VLRSMRHPLGIIQGSPEAGFTIDILPMMANSWYGGTVFLTFRRLRPSLTNRMPNKKPAETVSGRPRTRSRMQEMIGRVDWRVKGPKLLLLACVVVLGGMLVAGLWPFHSPRNQVTWLSGGNGLQFGRHGMIVSSGRFKAAPEPADGPCSLEIWFEPARTWISRTLLSFYAPERRRQFSLVQSMTDLSLQSEVLERHYQARITRFDVADVFYQGKLTFVTLTATRGDTSVYLNGAPIKTAANFPISMQDFAGQLVVGNSPIAGDSWRGQVRGLAVYRAALSPVEVRQDFETWSRTGRPDISETRDAAALYVFGEHAGNVIHNQVPPGTDLYIPDRYMIVDQAFLRPFWVEYYPSRSYWEGVVLINVIGFIPFGFLFCAYFSLRGRITNPALVTILLGFTVSLTIECLQALLPTRDSGTTDLITNTLGTCIGVWVYRWSFWRFLAARVWMNIARL
jgi:VanZ family protein